MTNTTSVSFKIKNVLLQLAIYFILGSVCNTIGWHFNVCRMSYCGCNNTHVIEVMIFRVSKLCNLRGSSPALFHRWLVKSIDQLF